MNRHIILLLAICTCAMTAKAQNKDKAWMFHDTINEPVTIMKELLVTPDGSDPVTYILNNVYRRSKSNRKKLSYQATANVDLIVRDADLIPEIAPKTLMFAAQMYLRTKGMWALFDYAMSRPSAQAQLQVSHTCRNGNITYGNGKILQGPQDMKKKVGRQLIEMCQFDPFEELYGKETIVDPRYRQKFDIKLEGSFEENGHLIYVLKARRYHGFLNERQTLHVVDRVWGIRRAEFTTRIFRSYRECKNIGGDIYMPWRKVDNPVQFDLEKAIQKGHELLDSKDDVSRYERKTMERAEKLAQGKRKYNPMMKMGYEIRYR